MASNSERVLGDSKALVELFTRLQENLGKATDKNESLLEAIESSEARASNSSGGGTLGGRGWLNVLITLRAYPT